MALLSPKVGEALYLNNAGAGSSQHNTFGSQLVKIGQGKGEWQEKDFFSLFCCQEWEKKSHIR